MAVRVEITPNDPDFLMWVGDGTANWYSRGVFSITNRGDAYFLGDLGAGIVHNAVSSSFYGLCTATTPNINSVGRPKRIISSIVYANSGSLSTDIGDSQIGATLILEKSVNSGASWTEMTRRNGYGTITSRLNSTTGQYDVDVRLSFSFTLTDNSMTGGMYRTVFYAKSGTFPLDINTNMGFQRVSISTNE